MGALDGIRISTSTIADTADSISLLNKTLSETLEKSQTDVQGLKGVWEGEAADTAVDAYNQFANKYFEEYKEMLDDYVKFLKSPAAEGWEGTEKKVSEIMQNVTNEMI